MAKQVPPGQALVYRHFGAADREDVAASLARLARRRNFLLLIGNDPGLATRCGAHGVHFAQSGIHRITRFRHQAKTGLISAASHSPAASRAAWRAGVDAVVRSVVFPSQSPSAAAASSLGPVRLALEVSRLGIPVIALGGINIRTVARAFGSGASGVACVSGAEEIADMFRKRPYRFRARVRQLRKPV